MISSMDRQLIAISDHHPLLLGVENVGLTESAFSAMAANELSRAVGTGGGFMTARRNKRRER